MNPYGAIIGGVIGFIGGTYGVSKGNRELTKAFNKQLKVVMLNYNYNQNALNQEERYALDDAKQELFNLSLKAIQNNSRVEAALAETGYEGRNAGKVTQSIRGQQERRKTAVKDAYYRQTDQIRSQKDSLYIQTDRQIQQARKALESQYTGGFQAAMKIADSTAKGAMIGGMMGSVGSSMMGSSGAPGVTTSGQGLGFMDALSANMDKYGSAMKAMNMFSSSLSSLSQNNQRRYNFFY